MIESDVASKPSEPPNFGGDQFLEVEEVMALLKISRTTLYQLMRRKLNPLPSVQIGKCRRFALEKVRGWVNGLGA